MDKFKFEKGQCVYVFWLDSTNLLGGWVYDELKAVPKEIETVGYVIDSNERAVMLSSTTSNSGGTVNPITIPIGCIQVVKIIEL